MSDSLAPITQLAATMPQIAGNPLDNKAGNPPSCPVDRPPMERMSNEILTKIYDMAVPEEKRACTARALALASKTMQPSGRRAMYNSIVLGDYTKSILLLRSLLQFPHNRELVRHLEVRPPVKIPHPGGPKQPRFVDMSKVLDTIYEGERCNPQLPTALLDDLKEELDPFPTETEWSYGEYPQGGYNTVTRAIIFLCQNIQSFKVQIMGQWSGSSCNYTRTQPRFLLAWARRRHPAIAFNHLRILDLDVASIAFFSRTPRFLGYKCMCAYRVTCPPTVEDLTLRHEDASLSRNFLPPHVFNDSPDNEDHDDDDDDDDDQDSPAIASSLDGLLYFLMPCSASLRKLRLLGGFDHAGLMEPSRLFTAQAVCENNWNTILPHFQQLVHLEFCGYGNPCPPDDGHRNTWPDNVYRYGTDKSISCLGQLPKLRYLKLPLVDLFPLSPAAFPDTAKGLSELAAGGKEIPRNLEKVEVYYFVEDVDKKKDPRERWAKSSQYVSRDRAEIEVREARMAEEAGWFPTKEETITWTRGY
ncbi:hypothetical protein N0V85_005669 [Neurospora sp. IMI 360204]|nr:hypothetical protein N0V85_005669 [Neurospora sp. IMI 360204]